MFGRYPKKIAIVLAIISAAAVMILSTFSLRNHLTILQGLAFVSLYYLCIKLERSLALLSVLVFIILGAFIREPIQSTESIRGVLFALALILLSGERRSLSPVITLYATWFTYLSLQLLPIKIFEEAITGVFPIATAKTVELMLYEMIGISFIEIFSTTSAKKADTKSDTLFGYQANVLIFAISTISLIIFSFSKKSIIPNALTELRTLPNPSSAIMLMMLGTFILIAFLAKKFSSTFENIFAHLELCATPDSGFLTLSRKPALPISEFLNYSKSIRKQSESLTISRKKSTELKVELNALKRQIQEMNEKNKDLSIMADSINIGLLALTFDGTITYVNRLFYEILDLEVSHAEMLHYTDLVQKQSEECESVSKAIEEALEVNNFAKFKTAQLSIEVVEWAHQDHSKKKAQNSLNIGNKRILVFLKKLDSSSTKISVPTAAN